MLERNTQRWVLLNCYWVSLSLQSTALLTLAIPTELSQIQPQEATFLLALLSSGSALLSTLIPPLAGAYSDAQHRRGIRRAPLIWLGGIVDLAGLLVMMSSWDPAGLAAGFLLATLGQSVSASAYQPLLPEVVASQAWGLAAGYRGAANLIGTILGLAIGSLFPPRMVYFLSGLLTLLGLWTLHYIEEPPFQGGEEPKARIRDFRDFSITFAGRFMVNFGITLLMTFVFFFFERALGVSQPGLGTALVAGVAMIGAVLSSIWAGSYSDRADRRKVVIFSACLMALAAMGFGLLPREELIMACALIFGLGFGAFRSTDWALALDTIPKLRDVARDLGILGIAGGIPGFIAPLFGNWVLSRFDQPLIAYRVLFILAGLCFALGAGVLVFIRPHRS